MKQLYKYNTAIEFIKDIPVFMFWWSFSLVKRWIINRKIWDIDIIVPSSFWKQFKDMDYNIEFNTNKYEEIVPEWIFIYTYDFPDWSIDIIFRKDFSNLNSEIINWYSHLDVKEILKQKEHLLKNWNSDKISKHEDDIKQIKKYLKLFPQ